MKCKNCRNLVKRIDEDGTLYDFCGMVIDSPDTDIERDCKYYIAATNADRIRAMSDKELADYFSELACFPGANKDICKGVANCMDCWLDWLKQEAE